MDLSHDKNSNMPYRPPACRIECYFKSGSGKTALIFLISRRCGLNGTGIDRMKPILLDKEYAALENFVPLSNVIPVTPEVAKIGGLYKLDFERSHCVGLADANNCCYL